MKRILTVVGARPQFIKAAAVHRALVEREVDEVLVHTGQHYDDAMSAVFFRDLDLPAPAIDLGVGSGTHATQTAAMLIGLERAVEARAPELILTYGDTNSTLAGALVAAKAAVPLAHVEAGLRSFRPGMAEEVNRVVTDRLSQLLFCPTASAVAQLASEGQTDGVHLVGDVMYDSFCHARDRANPSDAVARRGVEPGAFVLATVHRAENTEDPRRLAGIFDGLAAVAATIDVVLALHPRTRGALDRAGIVVSPGIRVIEPLPYFESIDLILASSAVVTDSGGLQKEAYFAGVPCVTTRSETEWNETLVDGWNRLVDADPAAIAAATAAAIDRPPGRPSTDEFGAGDAGQRIAELLANA